MSSTLWAWAGISGVLGLASGCSAPVTAGGCRQDSDCATIEACLASVCVPRIVGPYALAAVVVPDMNVGATSEIPLQLFASASTTLALLPSVVATGRAVSLPNTPFAQVGQGELSLTFVLPALVPGSDALQLHTVATVRDPGGVVAFNLTFPQARLGQTAKVFVTPRPPLDLVLPPVERDVVMAADMKIDLPSIQELRAVEGLVRNEFDQPAVGYNVRVFRGATAVGTRSPLAAEDGRFRVSFWRQAPPGLPGAPATLDVSAMGLATRPRLSIVLPEGASEVGSIRLPAHPVSRPFRIPVALRNAEGELAPVVGALLRFETPLSSSSPGTSAAFVQAVQSGFDGIAEVRLIPGGLESAKSYRLAVVSPASSEAASRCFDRFDVGPGLEGGESASTTATLELPPRPALTGVIQRADMSPVRKAVIRAIRTGPVPGQSDCEAAMPAGVTSTISEVDGQFHLRLEAGTYRIEIRPPLTDMAPLQSLDNVVVNHKGLQLPLRLPQGQLLEARVVNPDASACQICRVQLFGVSAQGTTQLRAEAVTDYEGRFRAVVPAN